jgi:indole-3-acetate monooxygenase
MRKGRLEDGKILGEDVFVQEAIARADAMVGAARAHVFQVVGDFWATLVAGRELTARQQANLQSVYPEAVNTCVHAVQLVYRAAGGAAIYQKGHLDRCLRDILTMNQHMLGSVRRYEAAGRLLLGLDPLVTLL